MEPIYELADLFGAQTSYYDVTGQLQHASPEALLEVLRALGAPLAKIGDAPDALRIRRQSQVRQVQEPVSIAWDGGPAEIVVRLPANQAGMALALSLRLESGETRFWGHRFDELPHVASTEVEGVVYVTRRLVLPAGLPWGYHRLAIEVGGTESVATLISTPSRAYEPPAGMRSKSWGVFLPLYALHSQQSWGAGDFGDLERLTDWVAGLGGGLVATLPLLAAFLDEPYEPGPYAPASRLFWNEFYLDVTRIPELERCPGAQVYLGSREFQSEIGDLRSAGLVDYRRQMAVKRRVLMALAGTFFAEPSARRPAFEKFLADRPQVEDYACFRAVVERHRASWFTWPGVLRDGTIREGDYDEEVKRYHLYVQWLADEQLQALAARARAAGPGFYLDLPLGVNSDSYDVYRHRDLFAGRIAVGAPPDPFFAKGQNWGFPPLHPEKIRADGYRYITAYLRHHLRLAGVLRIDHMMGFHRLFWIPQGRPAREGIYVRYPAGELYAVFNLESHRHKSILVGEDLGTVPPEVRPAMERHNVHRMYVMQYELQPQYQNALTQVYAGAVASLNTHDMPPFAAFWRGLDVDDRLDLGILDARVAADEKVRRQQLLEALIRSLRIEGHLHEADDLQAILKASLLHMASGPALVVLANLEDLWLATQPQNVPGTWHERPNWQRRAQHSLESLCRLPCVLEVLQAINGAIA